jgi:hypothetical protein
MLVWRWWSHEELSRQSCYSLPSRKWYYWIDTFINWSLSVSANGGPKLCHRVIRHSCRWRNTQGQLWCLSGSWHRDNASGNACTEFDNADWSICQSQWPRGLRCVSAAAHLLGLRGRIAPGQGCLSLWASCVVRRADHSSGGVLPNVLCLNKTKLNSVAWVRERTRPTERPPPVGEVSANFCG